MSAPTGTTALAPSPASSLTGSRSVWRAGLLAGVAAAAATTAVAGAARGAGVPVAVGGEEIPLAAFAQMTLLFTAAGVVLAYALARWARQPRRTFTGVTIGLTALSVVPDLAADATTATRLVLMTTHLVAAAIVIPVVASCLARRDR